MKRLIVLLVFMPTMVFAQHQAKVDSVKILRDSICKLNQRPVMTAAQFVKIYKYETLLKYYRLTKSRPVNKKYYYGWSARVFDK